MIENKDREDLIEGRNAVIEALRAERPIDKLYVSGGKTDKALGRIAAIASENGVIVSECDRRKLDAMSVTGAHQGVIAVAAVRNYCDLDDLLALARESGKDPFFIACDEIEDPHNLGAIIRTAECVGAQGVIIPKRRSAGITAVVDKASAGAAEYLPVARVPNMSAAIRELKQAGIWVYGTDAGGNSDCWHTDLTGPVCLVIGSEGFGLSRLVKETCDAIVGIPMYGHITSLNASAAASVMMYEVLRQRTLKQEG